MSPETLREFEAKTSLLVERCKTAGIKCELKEFDGDSWAIVHLPNGRQSRPITVWPERNTIDSLLSVPFEKYTFLGEYSAIACYATHTIEAGFTWARVPSRDLMRAFKNDSTVENRDDAEGQPFTIRGGDNAPNCVIVIGPCSDAFAVLNHGLVAPSDHKSITIQVTGVRISTHDEAVETLEHLTNSLFFQIDLARGIVLTLRRDHRRRRRFTQRRRVGESPPIEFPRTEYDSAPMSLYWYGRSSLGMPLLQFLAYYQCVEFYFPTYYQAEQKRRIRNILKNPTFRPDREADIGRVLAALNTSSRKGVPDEKSMLRATIHECLDAASLRSYFEAREDRVEFFAAKTKGLTEIKIPIKSPDTDLRDLVSDRIYDIRCKIVHTKSGANDDVELLLPFSNEAQQLDEDIALIEFIAQNVLVAGSSALILPVDKPS